MKAIFVFENINFEKKSDSFGSLGVGLKNKRNFNSEADLIKWIILFPEIISGGKIKEWKLNYLEYKKAFFGYEQFNYWTFNEESPINLVDLVRWIHNYIFINGEKLTLTFIKKIIEETLEIIASNLLDEEENKLKESINFKRNINPKISMGIGLSSKRDFNSEEEIIEWVLNFPEVVSEGEIKKWDPNEVIWSPNAVGADMGLPSGISPEGVGDPNLRAKYEAALKENQEKIERYTNQNRLHKWLKRYLPQAEKYIVQLYSAPPYNNEELKQLLEKYKIDRKTQTRIINAVDANIQKEAETIERLNKLRGIK